MSASLSESCSCAGFVRRLAEFCRTDVSTIIGHLCEFNASTGFAEQRTSQIEAWRSQIDILQRVMSGIADRSVDAGNWHILLEYEIPRRQKRPDVILLAEDVIFVIEFKIGARQFRAADRWQVEGYALDLRDFHAESEGRVIVPILCATEIETPGRLPTADGALAWQVIEANAVSLAAQLHEIFLLAHDSRQPAIHSERWVASAYKPTLTVVEAAERLFNGHNV